MFPLDPKTLDRVARLVVDIDGPGERRGHELEQLLRHSGWPDTPEYDGSPRVAWLVDALAERADEQATTERLLCRLCDPLEYDGGTAVADAFRRELNTVLASERLAVEYHSGRPVIGEVRDADHTVITAPSHLDDRLANLIANEQVNQVLLERMRQSQASAESGAYLLSLFGIGSFVEGLLYSVLTERYPEFLTDGFRDSHGKRRSARKAPLAVLIDTAHAKGLIELDAKAFLHHVRDFRNYIHPRHQLEMEFAPDDDTVRMCWAPVQAILNDLEESMSKC